MRSLIPACKQWLKRQYCGKKNQRIAARVIRPGQELNDRVIKEYEIFPSNGSLSHFSDLATPKEINLAYSKKTTELYGETFVWPSLGLIGASNKRILASSYPSEYQFNRVLKERAIRSKRVMQVDGVCVCVDSDYLWDNYYHLLVDNAPRLYGLSKIESSSLGQITLLIKPSASDLTRRLYRMLAPENTKFLVVPDDVDCVCAEMYLHLPRLSEGYGRASLPKVVAEWLRTRISESLEITFAKGEGRIYVSRRKAKTRRYHNEDELFDLLSRHNFTRYFLEDLSFESQVRLFANAGMVFGRHGAGLTNQIFSTGCFVVEHCDSDSRRNYYRSLAATLGHNYANIVGDSNIRDQDVIAPLEKIERLLTRLK